MARIVKRTRDGPYPVTIGGETKHICGCGLSNTQPFCNGTHKIARQEELDKLYWYDVYRTRMHATLKRSDPLLPGAQWRERLYRHIPDRCGHLVLDDGCYPN